MTLGSAVSPGGGSGAGRDQLSIVLKARPEDRNYVLYLVVEECLARSGKYLRPPIQIRFNGQLTYVPQSFFDAERCPASRIGGAEGITHAVKRDDHD